MAIPIEGYTVIVKKDRIEPLIDSGEIVLCPDVCTAIQSDDGANIAVKFGCELNLMGPN